MTPEEFVTRWAVVTGAQTEKAVAQSHFLDLCRLLDEPAPTEADPSGETYAFEMGATKATGGNGWADVWKAGHFAWEYKTAGKDLDAAFAQLQQYAGALGNPPLLVVSDMQTIRIHTAWTNTVTEVHTIHLADLLEAEPRRRLKAVFSKPDVLKPGLTRQALTEQAAERFATLARRLRERGHDAQRVAHFVNRMVFCLFAEDVGLLPNRVFQRLLDSGRQRPHTFEAMARELFGAMRTGGVAGFEAVDWFNGGLFDDDDALPLERDDILLCLEVARLDWAEIDPSVMGTLFERGLDPDKRSQLGAHYTDRDKIMLIVDPVIVEPLAARWEATKAEIAAALDKADRARGAAARTKARNAAAALYRAHLDRLRGFRVLDPACGSGNFLYLALLALKDLEHRAGLDVEAMGLQRELPAVGPECVRGIEINPFAAELARVSVWIGEIQWMLRTGYAFGRDPILKPLDTIATRDAILDLETGTEPVWPEADVVIGNPPFLGGKRLRDVLGDAYVDGLFDLYRDRVPAEADLVCYWFAKAWAGIRAGRFDRAGLVATNSIRGGASRRVLEPIVEDGVIFEAWDDEPWVIEGAAVRVALVCFAESPPNGHIRLDNRDVTRVHTNLTAGDLDLTRARRLAQNRHVAFMGDTKGGAFDVPGALARDWLALPLNPNGRPNADVLRPWVNGMDITRRPADKWIIDFGWEMSEREAALYEAPFQHVLETVKPIRATNRREYYRTHYWRHVEARPGMWDRLRPLSRFLGTPTIAKHRLFVSLDRTVCPDHQLIVIARDDDVTFGILHSRFHEAWALRLGSSLEDRPRYTPSTTFETFPFPPGLTPDIPAAEYAADPRAQAIAAAARRLDEVRRAWLNPPDLVERVPEVVPGFPDRLVPLDDRAGALLKKRTLTALYNERPAWLADAHADLDAAVAAAYGWPAEIGEDDALARLLALNLERSAG
jgi:type II restriction/modification system DNA methylase subunit YeeA